MLCPCYILHVHIDVSLKELNTDQQTLSLCLLEMSCASSSGQVDGEPQRALQPGDPGSVVRAHAGVSVVHTTPKQKWLLSHSGVFFFLPPSVILVSIVKLPRFSCCLLIGQPPGALFHAVPRTGGGSHLPVAREGGEDSREQAGARAEAEHHLPLLCQLRAAGPLPPSGAG